MSASLGTPFAMGALEVPIVKGQTAIGLRLKSSVAGQLVDNLSYQYFARQDIYGSKSFDFSDLMARVVHRNRKGNNVYKLLFLRSVDGFGDNISYDYIDSDHSSSDEYIGGYYYENYVSYIQWIHYLQNSWELSTKVYHSNYWYRSLIDNDYRYLDYEVPENSYSWRYNVNFHSRLHEVGIKHRWKYHGNNWTLRLGMDFIWNSYRNRFSSYYEEDLRPPAQGGPLDRYGKILNNKTWNGYTYLQFNRTIRQWDIKFSMALNQFKNSSYHEFQIIPRFAVQRSIGNKSLLYFNLDRNVQNQHVLSLSYSGLPNEIWVPANDLVPAQRSSQATLGYKSRHSRIFWSSAVYYKWLNGIIDLADQAISLNESV